MHSFLEGVTDDRLDPLASVHIDGYGQHNLAIASSYCVDDVGSELKRSNLLLNKRSIQGNEEHLCCDDRGVFDPEFHYMRLEQHGCVERCHDTACPDEVSAVLDQ